MNGRINFKRTHASRKSEGFRFLYSFFFLLRIYFILSFSLKIVVLVRYFSLFLVCQVFCCNAFNLDQKCFYCNDLPLLIFFFLFSFAHLNCYQHKFTPSAGVYCNFYEQSKHRFIACTSVETMT